MKLFGHHHHQNDSPWDEAPAWAIELVYLGLTINERLDTMAKTLDEILAQGTTALAQITKNTDLDNSIIALVNANTATIKDLKEQLAAAGTDPAKLQALADTMDAITTGATSQGQAVADAVTANTSAA